MNSKRISLIVAYLCLLYFCTLGRLHAVCEPGGQLQPQLFYLLPVFGTPLREQPLMLALSHLHRDHTTMTTGYLAEEAT